MSDEKEKEIQSEHCKDCCCARAWEALGVKEYTGKSISEHITELKLNVDKLQGRESLDLDEIAFQLVKGKTHHVSSRPFESGYMEGVEALRNVLLKKNLYQTCIQTTKEKLATFLENWHWKYSKKNIPALARAICAKFTIRADEREAKIAEQALFQIMLDYHEDNPDRHINPVACWEVAEKALIEMGVIKNGN